MGLLVAVIHSLKRTLLPAWVACTLVLAGGVQAARSQNAAAASAAPWLLFSTYLGGATPCATCPTAHSFAQNAAADAQGNIYVTGATSVTDFPVKDAFQPQLQISSTLSAFVTKLDPAGNLLWSTYLGGDGESMGIGVAAMPDGGVAVAGLTSSDAAGSFPTQDAFQPDFAGGESDYFVAVFDAAGHLRYATYLGGGNVEGTPNAVFTDNNSNGNSVATDSHGLVYVTGATASAGITTTAKFPVSANALQPDMGGGSSDSFLAIIDPGQAGAASLVYLSFLGGGDADKGHGIAVSPDGSQITVGGYTQSTDFPTTTNAYRSAPPPSPFTSNGTLSQFTSSLPGDPASVYASGYSTYLGANAKHARDDIYGITLDPAGVIYATGRTQSALFPMVQPPARSIYNSAPYLASGVSGDEPFLAKIDPSQTGGDSLVYSTFLGGGSATKVGETAFCTSVAVDAQGRAYVAGETSSAGTLYQPSAQPVEAPNLFPYTQDALFPALQGSFDAILMAISPDGGTLAYSTFFGATGTDRTYGLVVDAGGNVILSGLTSSPSFPLKHPVQTWPGNSGSLNAFVTKLGPPLELWLPIMLRGS
jgi:hypothetical protein